MKYGPISAAISAMIKAIANPSSVVCTVSPLERVPARRPRAAYDAVHPSGCRCHRDGDPEPPRRSAINAGVTPYIETTVAKSQQPRVTVSRDRPPSPACGQPLEATQHEGRPPFRILRVIQPQAGE